MPILILIILILLVVILLVNEKQPTENNKVTVANIDYSKYITKNYIMTPTELTFYKELKKVTDKLELSIFPQVDLERIIQVKDNNYKDRNRIKSRSIDYTIVNNKNCRIQSNIHTTSSLPS